MPKIFIRTAKSSYLSGEVVSGNVILENKDSQKSKFLTISILGKVSSKWSVNETKPTINLHGHIGAKYRRTYYKGEELIINQYCILFNHEEPQPLPTGTSSYPFQFTLPEDCPPTFGGSYGKVTYELRAVLHRHVKRNIASTVNIWVAKSTDLEKYPKLSKSVKRSGSQNTWLLLKSGHVDVTAELAKPAFRPGEVVPIRVSIHNQSSKPTVLITARLILVSYYTTTRNNQESTRCANKTMGVFRQKVNLSPGSQNVEEVSGFRVPLDAVTSFETSVIKVRYVLKVGVRTLSTFKPTLELNLPFFCVL